MASENECSCGTTWRIVEWQPFPEEEGATPGIRRSLRKADIFVAYEIEVIKKQRKYTIFRRFSQFYELNQKIKPRCEHIVLSFPPRTFMQPLDKATLDFRKRELDIFIKHLADHRVLRNCEPVRNFFADEITDDNALVKREVEPNQHSSDKDQPKRTTIVVHNTRVKAKICKMQIGDKNIQYNSREAADTESILSDSDEEFMKMRLE
ncbi:sorting nexin-16-like [Ptychodera flava]|uniref:sorting nexin-16-like n=1 Tax=Ptychodera flava TaxID=63121 RepID=UPI00396AA813